MYTHSIQQFQVSENSHIRHSKNATSIMLLISTGHMVK